MSKLWLVIKKINGVIRSIVDIIAAMDDDDDATVDGMSQWLWHMDDGDDTDVVVLVAVAEVVVHVVSCSYMVRRGNVVRNCIFVVIWKVVMVFDRISSSVGFFLLFQLDLNVDVCGK